MLHVSGPAAPAALAFIALLGRWTVAAVINNRGPMSPGVTRLAVIF